MLVIRTAPSLTAVWRQTAIFQVMNEGDSRDDALHQDRVYHRPGYQQ